MALYSEKVMDHFRNPRNVGVIEDAKFETFGCGSAIASSSPAAPAARAAGAEGPLLTKGAREHIIHIKLTL